MRARFSIGAMLVASLGLPCSAQCLAAARVGASPDAMHVTAIPLDAEVRGDRPALLLQAPQGVVRGRCPAPKVALALVAGGFVGAGAGHLLVELFSFGGLLTQHDTQQRQLRIARLLGAIAGAAAITFDAVHNGADADARPVGRGTPR